MKLGQFIDNLNDENKKIKVCDMYMNILSVYDGRNSIDKMLNKIKILNIKFTDECIEVMLHCTNNFADILRAIDTVPRGIDNYMDMLYTIVNDMLEE